MLKTAFARLLAPINEANMLRAFGEHGGEANKHINDEKSDEKNVVC